MKRRRSRRASKPRLAVFQPEFREDLRYWVRTDRKTAVRVLELVEAVLRVIPSRRIVGHVTFMDAIQLGNMSEIGYWYPQLTGTQEPINIFAISLGFVEEANRFENSTAEQGTA